MCVSSHKLGCSACDMQHHMLEMYHAFDTDKNGVLSYDEFATLMSNCVAPGEEFSPKQVLKLFQMVRLCGVPGGTSTRVFEPHVDFVLLLVCVHVCATCVSLSASASASVYVCVCICITAVLCACMLPRHITTHDDPRPWMPFRPPTPAAAAQN